MSDLRAIFAFHAGDDVPAAARLRGAASETEAGGVDSLTLEFRDNPLESFMRRIDRLVDIDPAEAFRMARHALQDKTFGPAAETRLSARMTELATVLHRERELGAAFALSVAGVTARPASVPVPAAPAPAFAAPAPF